MAFTEFCCRSGGSNLNAGTRTGNSTEPGTAADFTYASGTWVGATNTFTVASGNPSTDGVAANNFVSLYPDGSTVTGYLARVASVTATTIVLSSSVFVGTKPADGTSTRTIKVGGAWKGPNAAENFQFNFLTKFLTTTTATDTPRVNLKNDANYNVTAAVVHSAAPDALVFQGYATSYGDLGRFTLDGGTTGASYALLTLSAANTALRDAIIQNNGSTGSASGLSITGNSSTVERVVVNNVCGHGIEGNSSVNLDECETYLCNKNNTANKAGISLSSPYAQARNCISHDNAGTNSSGFRLTDAGYLVGCIADTNGGAGFRAAGGDISIFSNCDAYNNSGDGIVVAGPALVVNSNFLKNGGYGINCAVSVNSRSVNCGFGAGTQANSSGTTNGRIEQSGAVNYATGVTPWTDHANGDFRINLAAAKGAGRGAFTQTQASYAGTIAYPDIGAAQHQDTGGSSGPLAQLKSFGRGSRY